MLPSALKILLAVAAAYVAVAALLWTYQDRLAFPAPRRELPSPGALGFPDGERVTLTTADDVTLHGWYLPPRAARGDSGTAESSTTSTTAPGLLWFYGNMETVAALAPVIRRLRLEEIGLLIVDYRGYGESGGSPTESGLYRDAEAAWMYLTARREIDSTRVGVYGRSLGSAVALYLAISRPVRTVVLDSPFSSAREMARLHYWFFPRFLLRHRLDNVARARELSVPLLVFHGTHDRIVPISMGRAVARAGRAREFVEIINAGHNDTYDYDTERYRQHMTAFLRETLQ